MELVIDTNCLISALIFPGKSRELICSLKLSLFAPEEIINETLVHKEEIVSKSKISEEEFNLLINILFSRITIIPLITFESLKQKAKSLVTHSEDTPFMALALSKKLPIWFDDKALKQQSVIKIFTTEEIIKELGL